VVVPLDVSLEKQKKKKKLLLLLTFLCQVAQIRAAVKK
jgi:hypothetical protein